VPAAAVIQKEQVLFGIIGRKWRVGCLSLLAVKAQRMPLVGLLRQTNLRMGEANRISSGGVKSLDIRRNAYCEGNSLAHF
jgi:hypothetical protein